MSFFDNFAELSKFLPEKGRLMGLDLGQKVIGIAISDVTQMIASPLQSLVRKGFRADCKILTDLIGSYEIKGIVVGLPVHLSGEWGDRAEWAVEFARSFAEQLAIPVGLADERWTTKVAERLLISADMSRKRRAEVVDKVAACYLLQGVLDWLQQQKGR